MSKEYEHKLPKLDSEGSSEEGQPEELDPEEPQRVVAFGDVHGDINAALDALQLADLIDDNRDWRGGNTYVVQVGDQLDRGDTERQILDLFEKLRAQAEEAGGGFFPPSWQS